MLHVSTILGHGLLKAEQVVEPDAGGLDGEDVGAFAFTPEQMEQVKLVTATGVLGGLVGSVGRLEPEG